MAKKRIIRKPRLKSAPRECYFCKEKKSPNFFEQADLQRFLTERGKITPFSRNGLCAKHQRGLAKNVKYARHLAILPFVGQG